MIAVWCPREQARVLLWPSRMRGLRNTVLGIECEWECWCGQRVEVLTGRTAPEPPSPSLVDAEHGSR